MHLPVASDDTLPIYWYLNTHVLIAEGQFLFLIACAHTEQIKTALDIWCFSVLVSHSNLSAQYKIDHMYIGVTYDETKAVAILDQ